MITCKICSRCFRKESDKKLHKCLAEHSKSEKSTERGCLVFGLVASGSEAKEALQSTHVEHKVILVVTFLLA